jgi:hypothetical protein
MSGMYNFSIKKQEKGGYKFELDGINILTESYQVEGNKHLLSNPSKTVAYFSVGDNLFGISNYPQNLSTAEDVFDSIKKQYNLIAAPVEG